MWLYLEIRVYGRDGVCEGLDVFGQKEGHSETMGNIEARFAGLQGWYGYVSRNPLACSHQGLGMPFVFSFFY